MEKNMTKNIYKLCVRVSAKSLESHDTNIAIFIEEIKKYISWDKLYKTKDQRPITSTIYRGRYTIVFCVSTDHGEEIIEKLKKMKAEKKDYGSLRECYWEPMEDQVDLEESFDDHE